MPVDKNSPVVKLHFFYHREKFQEIDISPSADAVDFYSVMDVPMGAQEKIHCEDKRPSAKYAFRPQIHFTAETGWINDPNGLICSDGVYHLYH